MTYLKLFLTFMQIGAVSFGGGYGMISLIREKCLSFGWLNEEEIMNFIAVSESTPGPIAVNMATFIGSSQAGFLGSFLATLGLVIPSFVIILIIAALIQNLLKLKGVQAVISGIKPVVVGLITATSLTMLLNVVFGVTVLGEGFNFDLMSAIILATIIIIATLYKKIRKKAVSPIALIVVSAILGIIMY